MSQVPLIDHAVIIGLGLIGGSIALELKERQLAKFVFGYDTSEQHIRQALQAKIVHDAKSQYDKHLSDADLVVLAVPPRSLESVLAQIAPFLSPQVVVTDTSSIKMPILQLFQKEEYRSIRFVGGHPISGAEKFGPLAAKRDLFWKKRFVLTPDATTDTDAMLLIEDIWRNFGALIERMEPEKHDLLFGYVSHLPHLLAYSSIELIGTHGGDEYLQRLGAGLRDFSRIASSEPRMWADIFLSNPEFLGVLQNFRQLIDSLEEDIKNQDFNKLIERFRQAKQWRDQSILQSEESIF